MNLIGFDFSINKPAACIFFKNNYHFYSWPYNIPEKYVEVFKNSGVNIIERQDNKERGDTLSSKMNYEVKNAAYLSKLIISSIKPFINNNTYIGFEGLSYASSGDVGVQLGGYKYILMHDLSKHIPYEKMFTYTPITIKSVAGCAKRGMGKVEMIEKFIECGPKCKFRTKLFEHSELFQSPKAKNWIIHLDDLIDSYWTLETLRKKENLIK